MFYFVFTERRRNEKSQKRYTVGNCRVSVSQHDRLLWSGHCFNTHVALLFAGTLSTHLYFSDF